MTSQTFVPSVRALTLHLWPDGPQPSQRWARAGLVVAQRRPDLVFVSGVTFVDAADLAEVGYQEPGGADSRWVSTAELLAAATGMRVAACAAADPGPSGTPVGNAILARVPVHESGEQTLPGDREQGRGAVFAWLTAPSGRPVLACATTLTDGLGQEAKRLEQAMAVEDLVRRELNEHRHGWAAPEVLGAPVVVLGGSLGSEPDGDAVRWLTGRGVHEDRSAGWTDAWAATSADPGWTFDPRNPWVRDAHTGPAPLPPVGRRLDYVLVRGDVTDLPGAPLASRLVGHGPAEVAGGRHAATRPGRHATPKGGPEATGELGACPVGARYGVEADLWVPPS